VRRVAPRTCIRVRTYAASETCFVTVVNRVYTTHPGYRPGRLPLTRGSCEAACNVKDVEHVWEQLHLQLYTYAPATGAIARARVRSLSLSLSAIERRIVADKFESEFPSPEISCPSLGLDRSSRRNGSSCCRPCCRPVRHYFPAPNEARFNKRAI